MDDTGKCFAGKGISAACGGAVWDNSLATGNELVDRQHRRIFKLVGDLARSCEENADACTLNETLSFLSDYTIRHFSDEEALMLECGYSDYNGHMQKHDDFKELVAEFIKRFREDGSSAELKSEVNKTIARWLVEHIKSEDSKISDHIRSKGMASL